MLRVHERRSDPLRRRQTPLRVVKGSAVADFDVSAQQWVPTRKNRSHADLQFLQSIKQPFERAWKIFREPDAGNVQPLKGVLRLRGTFRKDLEHIDVHELVETLGSLLRAVSAAANRSAKVEGAGFQLTAMLRTVPAATNESTSVDNTIRGLLRSKHSPRISGLPRFLRFVETEVRKTAALQRLASMGVAGAPALPFVVNALNSRHETVRLAAVAALATICPEISERADALSSLRHVLSGTQAKDADFRIAEILKVVTLVPGEWSLTASDKKVAMKDKEVHKPASSSDEIASEPAPNSHRERAARDLTEARSAEVREVLGRGYVIRIPRRMDRARAMGVLLGVPVPYHSGAEDKFVVMDVHIKALKEAGIPFEDVTKRPEKNV